MKLVTDAEVEKYLLEDPDEYVHYIHTRIREFKSSDRVWLKDKIIYKDPFSEFGDIRPMTCFTERTKIVKVISTNPHRKKHPSVSVGATLVLDQKENFPTHVIEATAMSGIRTAAMVMWAISAGSTMSPINTVLIVGKGRVGSYIRQLLDECFTFPQVSMLDTDAKTAKKMRYDQDIVITATDSREPFITKDNCSAKYIISVGADTDFNHEIDEDLLNVKKVFVDILEAKCVGDLKGASDAMIVGTMWDLMNEDLHPDIFISVGSALMDALTVEYLMKYV